ncbi:MAG: hypothetical protein EPN23_04640 [Verrucomicrobia bacterium]|nr:MAG: hypothetical protein EPN23_04640 [Verrucomicrobiota bacterium]
MIALLLATLDEAQPLLTQLAAEPLVAEPYATYWFAARGRRPGGFVVISGMGGAQAAAATAYAINTRGASAIINLGICGALKDGFAPGHFCRVTAVGDEESRVLQELDGHNDVWQALPTARLVSVREPVFGGERKTKLATHADVVEMEGAAVAEACRQHAVPCTLLKGVSDLAHAGGREELHRNLRSVSELLAREVVAGLERWPQQQQSLANKIANFVKVEHTIFSLPLLFAGAWLGAGGRMPSLKLLGLIALAGLGARTLGMAMNRILDRRLDLLNRRTVGRELPSGKMTPMQAWGVAFAGLLVYLVACALLGPVCLKLAAIPAVVLISYSLLKRFTPLCHFGIGLCLALGPLGAFVAVSGGTAMTSAVLLLALFTFCWMSGFDIIYALQDLEADRRNGVHSIPAALGSGRAQIVAGLVHAVAVGASAWLWWLVGGGLFAGLALLVATAAFVLAYVEKVPLHVRFFPISAIAGIAGALIPLLGALR